MSTAIPPAWSTGQVPNGFAGLPSGALGRIGGRLMSVLNRRQQLEVLGLIGPAGGARALEVGHGPGVLLGLLARRPDIAHVVGVDPSLDMRTLAVRRLARQIATGRVEVRPGSASETGLPDAAVDLVVTVNTVSIWPDLDAGAAELGRVLAPGGRAFVSWHGGDRPARMARGLLLPTDKLDRIEAALREHIGRVRRVNTPRCTVFEARR